MHYIYVYTVYPYSISSSPIGLLFVFWHICCFFSSFSPDFCFLCCRFLCRSLVACMSTSMCLWYIIYIYIYIYMRVVLNSFIWKTPSSPKKNLLLPNFRELYVFLSRYMLAKIFKKNVDVWYPQIVPGVWSLVTLHSAAAVLKHLRSALRCWSLLTFIGQFWHNKSTV